MGTNSNVWKDKVGIPMYAGIRWELQCLKGDIRYELQCLKGWGRNSNV